MWGLTCVRAYTHLRCMHTSNAVHSSARKDRLLRLASCVPYGWSQSVAAAVKMPRYVQTGKIASLSVWPHVTHAGHEQQLFASSSPYDMQEGFDGVV